MDTLQKLPGTLTGVPAADSRLVHRIGVTVEVSYLRSDATSPAVAAVELIGVDLLGLTASGLTIHSRHSGLSAWPNEFLPPPACSTAFALGSFTTSRFNRCNSVSRVLNTFPTTKGPSPAIHDTAAESASPPM